MEEIQDRQWLLFLSEGDVGAPQELSCKMDERLWPGIPDDVLERVLTKLPLASHYRFRAVSKAWLALLSSPTFLRQCVPHSGSSSPSPWVCSFGTEPTSLPKWEMLPHLPGADVKVNKIDLSFLPNKVAYICTSDEGLLCFRTCQTGQSSDRDSKDRMSLHVCNPLTRRWRELPEIMLQDMDVVMMSMEVSPNLDSFKVVVVSDEESFFNWKIHVFDSQTDTWGVKKWVTPGGGNRRSVLSGHFIYCYADAAKLFVYDIQQGRVVRDFGVPKPAGVSYRYFGIVAFRGSVFLVGQLDPFTGYGIWRLDEVNRRWVELSLLPEAQFKDLLQGLNPDSCVKALHEVITVGNFFCMNIHIRGQNRCHSVLAFHTLTNSWHVFPFPNCGHECFLLQTFLASFQPRLSLLAA